MRKTQWHLREFRMTRFYFKKKLEWSRSVKISHSAPSLVAQLFLGEAKIPRNVINVFSFQFQVSKFEQASNVDRHAV